MIIYMLIVLTSLHPVQGYEFKHRFETKADCDHYVEFQLKHDLNPPGSLCLPIYKNDSSRNNL